MLRKLSIFVISFFQIFRQILVIGVIGNECLQFLALLDHLVYEYLEENQCLEEEIIEENTVD